MKNTKQIVVGAIVAMTISTFASAADKGYKAEEKIKVSGLTAVLPASLPVLETPAPLNEKVVLENNKHTATQKAAIVGLTLKSNK